jgi:hypothetical protein
MGNAVILPDVILNVFNAEGQYAEGPNGEGLNVECYYAEGRFGECRGTLTMIRFFFVLYNQYNFGSNVINYFLYILYL